MPSRPSNPSRRTPALIASAASVLLASGLAVSLAVALRSFEAELDSDEEAIDLDQTAVAVWWAGDVALRWAFISAAGSLCGVLGLVLRKSKLHAVFALTTAFDLLATIFLTLTLLLLTFSPSLSEPFGDFVCSSSYASDFSASARALLARPSEHATSSWSNGIELAFWGVEACEDAWQTAMVRVLVGCAVTIALRAYGTWVTWDANVELKDLEDRGLVGAWPSVRAALDEVGVEGERGESDNSKGMVEKVVRRLSSSSGSRPTARYTPLALEEARSSRTLERRSNTLPHPSLPTSVEEKRRPTRAQSDDIRRNSSSSSPNRRNSSTEPRLVLVPFVIDSLGHAVYEPSSPTLHMPPPQQQECGASARRSLSALSTRPSPPSPRRPSPRSMSSSSSSSCPSLSASASSSSAPSSPASATSPASPPPPPPPLTPPLIFTAEPSRMSSSSSASTSPARCQSNSTKTLDSAANRTRWTRAHNDDDIDA